jgi:hypothetical protein
MDLEEFLDNIMYDQPDPGETSNILNCRIVLTDQFKDETDDDYYIRMYVKQRDSIYETLKFHTGMGTLVMSEEEMETTSKKLATEITDQLFNDD